MQKFHWVSKPYWFDCYLCFFCTSWNVNTSKLLHISHVHLLLCCYPLYLLLASICSTVCCTPPATFVFALNLHNSIMCIIATTILILWPYAAVWDTAACKNWHSVEVTGKKKLRLIRSWGGRGGDRWRRVFSHCWVLFPHQWTIMSRYLGSLMFV